VISISFPVEIGIAIKKKITNKNIIQWKNTGDTLTRALIGKILKGKDNILINQSIQK
jgi:hypothetical protein